LGEWRPNKKEKGKNRTKKKTSMADAKGDLGKWARGFKVTRRREVQPKSMAVLPIGQAHEQNRASTEKKGSLANCTLETARALQNAPCGPRRCKHEDCRIEKTNKTRKAKKKEALGPRKPRAKQRKKKSKRKVGRTNRKTKKKAGAKKKNRPGNTT